MFNVIILRSLALGAVCQQGRNKMADGLRLL